MFVVVVFTFASAYVFYCVFVYPYCSFFFVKHNTAYDVRISVWSSDVCSSDLSTIFCDCGSSLQTCTTIAAAACLRDQGVFDNWRTFIDTIQIVNIDDLDFRHLVLLDALLKRHSVSAAARELDLPQRSEEHTSELQSLMRISYAVFCSRK